MNMNKMAIMALFICTAVFAQQKGSFTDPRDGKTYKTTKIGNQIWMAQNLDYGGRKDDIGRCFGGKSENCKKYGTLYAYDEAVRVCPSGWHLPSNREWRTLVDFAGGTGMAAKKLKAKNGWSEPNCRYITEETNGRGKVITTEHNECATDEFGFSALPTPGGGSSEKREYDSSEFWDSNWWNSNGGIVEINGIVDPYGSAAIMRSEVSYMDDALDFYPDT